MTQFHVHRLSDGVLVLDLHSDLNRTGTRVVAPLLPESGALPSLPPIEPRFEIAGRAHALHTAEMAAVPERLLGEPPVADLSAADYTIRGVLGMVFAGF